MAVSWIKTIKKAFPLVVHCDYVVAPMMTNGHVFLARSAMFFPRMMSKFRLRNYWGLGRCAKACFQAQTDGTPMKVDRP